MPALDILRETPIRGMFDDWDIAAPHSYPDDGSRGVLNDWDLAVDLHAPTAGATPLLPLGTPPFMIERLYRHDLESLFYVLTWAACCYKDARRLDPLPEMFERWALGGFSIRPRDLMAYDDPHPLDSKTAFIAGWYQWPRDILPTGEPRDIPWREPGYIAEGLRFFFMEDEAARRAVRSRPAGRAYRGAAMKALREGREPPPRPREADEPEKMWEGFCAAVREVIEDIISVFNSKTRL